MSTDDAWRAWGEQDPYFAVLTDERYRAANLTEEAKRQFFESGRAQVRHVLETCRRHFDRTFQPARVFDFGCGVGRVALPFAEQGAAVVGADVSAAMLREAQANALAMGIEKASFVLSDDSLSTVQGPFDLVHSSIVLQHIEIPRGRALFQRLIDLVAPAGMGAIQVTYAKTIHGERYGQPPPPLPLERPVENAKTRIKQGLRSLGLWPRNPLSEAAPQPAPEAGPEMQMNAYHLGELAYLMQTSGIRSFHAAFTDHGGELGVFLFFRKPPAPV